MGARHTELPGRWPELFPRVVGVGAALVAAREAWAARVDFWVEGMVAARGALKGAVDREVAVLAVATAAATAAVVLVAVMAAVAMVLMVVEAISVEAGSVVARVVAEAREKGDKAGNSGVVRGWEEVA